MLQRLRQELDSACFHRLYTHRHVGTAADEDDRHVVPICKLFLQFEAVELWQVHIEYQTAGDGGPGARQELLRRRK